MRWRRPWRGYGGFDHNAQALRIVTRLEHRYASYDGLNLCWETLEGLVKHNGPLTDAAGQGVDKYAGRGVPLAILEYDQRQPLDLATYAAGEAQAAAIADDIAYNTHDIDDGLRAGLFELDDLADVPLPASSCARSARAPGLERSAPSTSVSRRMITRMVEDVIAESRRRLAVLDAKPAPLTSAPRRAPVDRFSRPRCAEAKGLKAYLYRPHLSPSARRCAIRRAPSRRARPVRRLHGDPARCREWRARARWPTARRLAPPVVADFVAGMTDRYALQEHRRLFDATPDCARRGHS